MQTEQLIAQLAAEPAAAPAVSPLRLGRHWLLGLLVYGIIVTLFSSTRPDLWLAMQHPLFLMEILLLLALVITSVVAAALLSFPDLYQRRGFVYVPLGLLACFAVVMLLALMADPRAAQGPGHGLGCLTCISLYAIIPGLLLLRAMARLASTHGAWAGVMAFLAAFAAGGLLLRLHEPTDAIAHVLVWHYAPMAGVALLGMLVGRRFLRW